MKRLLSFAIAAMLAGQAWAQSTFWVEKLKYNITDNKNNYVWLQAYQSPFTNEKCKKDVCSNITCFNPVFGILSSA